MSVLIKGMEMPKNCCVCAFSDVVPGEVWCKSSHEIVPDGQALDETKRPDFCPLLAVPPHGDLIDRDALLKQSLTEKGMYPHWIDTMDIKKMPVIIPAEREGTK